MIANYGYQLYQDQRTKTRAEILAADAQLSRQAAAVYRAIRALVAQLTVRAA
jgi:hypothetical protein